MIPGVNRAMPRVDDTTLLTWGKRRLQRSPPAPTALCDETPDPPGRADKPARPSRLV